MRISLIILALLAVACSGAGDPGKVPMPPNVEAMTPVAGGKHLERYYPGYDGRLFTFGEGAAAYHFGILTAKKPGRNRPPYILVGIGAMRSWSRGIPLETEDWNIDALQVRQAWFGDPEKDGVPDLLMRVRIQSTQKATGLKQERHALYVFRLGGKSLRLTFYATLALKGSARYEKKTFKYDYLVDLSWTKDDNNATRSLVVEGRDRFKQCTSPNEKVESCVNEDEGLRQRWVWDEDMKTWRPDDAKDARLQVPSPVYR